MPKRNQPELDVKEFDDGDENESVNEEEEEMFDKNKLKELKEKDPDFYEFMLKNDPTMFQEEEVNDEEMGWTMPDTEEQGDLATTQQVIENAKKGNDSALLQSVLLFVDAVQEKRIETASDYEAIMTFAVDELPKLIKNKKGMFKIYMRGVVLALKNIDEPTILHVFIDIIKENADKYAISDSYSKCISSLSVFAFNYKSVLRSIAIETMMAVIKASRKDENRMEKSLRIIFGNYMKSCKQFSRNTSDLFNESQQFIKKISLFNMKATYNILFEYIRNIALSTKNCNTDLNAFKSVCSFGCIKTFEIIAICLKANVDEKVTQLYHPFCQLLCGLLNFVKGITHFPVVLHFIQILNSVVSEKLFVSPIPPILVAFEQLSQIKPKPSSAEQGSSKKSKKEYEEIDFSYSLQISKEETRNSDFIVSATNALIKELTNYFNIFNKSIALPELACQCISSLKKITKQCKIVVLNNKINTFIQKLNKNIEVIKQKRNGIDFGPFDVTKVMEFESN
ncbi:nucleolar complex protein 2 family protein, putative [Entamoeba histolytica HM-1:IMSS-B]|uniref:Nucleolar complex protein 2 homolog, putative n=6 Tax=Entamoeba histolytica TaxID=5759 RepID=C4M9H6_ENTH1|nr:nucleolar complex protein 2 homolog, putative [Entamoeba histolytica HM-1:IMSS]EMD44562.1 nucleolar complex family protein [Entamoeba histolytica KU27]EMH74747.1 nucleolar complex protein 2 family protein, putative [Entamoeba histolytica HM-1:IMSS-B]EMS16162.1 nucleolar complex protein 2 family protein [Entamoeba histolytica HM-3:IMSS]ENY63842.1 nucleolar complex protein 2 family protein, putative [Entamoeba histolytica HM-1:IMSS-A]GAT98313.1 nucleolar complex protein 2 homolog putative [En|eukprot:XP_656638.1 nucleolar complex protein 2 homolog, putative [Entamoeba histolytica HM-1:IMSS]